MAIRKYRKDSFENGIFQQIKDMPYGKQLKYISKQLHLTIGRTPLPADYEKALVNVASDTIENHYGGQSSSKALEKKAADYQKLGLPTEISAIRERLETLTPKSRSLKQSD